MRWIGVISVAIAVIGLGALALWGLQHRHAALHRITSMPLPPTLRERERGLRWPLLVGNAPAPVQIPAPGGVRIEFGRIDSEIDRMNSTATDLP
jgi:hypothetical protein